MLPSSGSVYLSHLIHDATFIWFSIPQPPDLVSPSHLFNDATLIWFSIPLPLGSLCPSHLIHDATLIWFSIPLPPGSVCPFYLITQCASGIKSMTPISPVRFMMPLLSDLSHDCPPPNPIHADEQVSIRIHSTAVPVELQIWPSFQDGTEHPHQVLPDWVRALPH